MCARRQQINETTDYQIVHNRELEKALHKSGICLPYLIYTIWMNMRLLQSLSCGALKPSEFCAYIPLDFLLRLRQSSVTGVNTQLCTPILSRGIQGIVWHHIV